MSDIIRIKQLSAGYNGKEVLHAVDLNISQGDYVSIIGPNGAGKSTLIKCINRILQFKEGIIELFGRSLTQYAQKDLGKLIGYVPQTQEQSFSYTVHDFVMMGRYPYLNPFVRTTADDEKVVNEVLHTIELTDFAQRKVNRLSGGERQKVYLAASLAQQPKILLLDEPTAHLDPKYHMEIQKIISDISKQYGITVLHVTHDLNHIVAWSKKILAIKDGRIHSYGTPQEIITKDNLKDIFETEFLFMSHPETQETIIVPNAK